MELYGWKQTENNYLTDIIAGLLFRIILSLKPGFRKENKQASFENMTFYYGIK